MDVEHRLEGGAAVVDPDISCVGQFRRAGSPGDPLADGGHLGQRFRRGVGEIYGVLFGNHQRVAAGERADVKDRKVIVVFVNSNGRGSPGGDRTEHAGHDVTVLGRADRGYAAAVDARDLAFAGAAAQAKMLADGEVTAPELLETYLERIARLDSQLRCYRVVLSERARREAAAAQDRLDAGDRLPLLGVPVAIKDDVDVAGEVTACGSAGHRPAVTSDAAAVCRLRAAGAVIIGKTNVPELMMFPYTESLTFGATRNPWNPNRTPGGSSGGSAVAVAAGLAPLALGSDGGGSIRIPSSWCGLFGLKPQRDRVSLDPHDDAWHGLSVNGPIARSVVDAALFLDATTTVPAPEGEFVAAATRAPGKLRIALSTKVPVPMPVRVGKRNWRRSIRPVRYFAIWATKSSCETRNIRHWRLGTTWPAICAASAMTRMRRLTRNFSKRAPATWRGWVHSSLTDGWIPFAPRSRR